jgi:predicted membrane channel-forming protein YqfA (hemolysin III family)
MWHNETVNVWTHLLGCILFATLAVWIKIYLVPVFKSDQDSLDAWLLNLDQ